MKSFRKDGSSKESEKKKERKKTGKDKITRLKRTGKNNTQEMATIVFIHIRNSTRTHRKGE